MTPNTTPSLSLVPASKSGQEPSNLLQNLKEIQISEKRSALALPDKVTDPDLMKQWFQELLKELEEYTGQAATDYEEDPTSVVNFDPYTYLLDTLALSGHVLLEWRYELSTLDDCFDYWLKVHPIKFHQTANVKIRISGTFARALLSHYSRQPAKEHHVQP